MRKLIKSLTFVLILVAAVGCEENFSPEGRFLQNYVLNSVIRNDTSTQMATVMRNFELDGNESYSNSFIDDVYLRLWQGLDSVYIFKDTTVTTTNSNGEQEKRKYYYLDNFIPDYDKELEIEAVLPNGRRLKANTTVPQPLEITDTSAGGTKELFSIPPYHDIFKISWAFDELFLVSDVKIELLYRIDDTEHTAEIPLEYIRRDGKDVPRYLTPGNYGSFEIDMDVIDKVMRSLAEGINNKSRINIKYVRVDIIVYDESLSSYYAANADLRDDFSVRVDKPEYSNIEGGFGLFGCFVRKEAKFYIDPIYIQSFGYSATILEP